MSEKQPEAMQGFGPQWPGQEPGAYQFVFPSPFFLPFPFLFRIPPRFFIGFLPRRRRRRRHDVEGQEEAMGWCIRNISENEYAYMMGMGFPEVEIESE